MKHNNDTKESITVQEFFKFGSKRLKMRLIAGAEGMNKTISNQRVQKTGLALANFVECSTQERVQLLGRTEMQYLEQLDPEQREATISNLLSCDLACFVVTSEQKVPKYLIEAMDRYKTPLLSCKLESEEVIDYITHYLDLLLAPRTSRHGSLLDIFGLGVLLIGDSGAGKSECALELIARGHRLVADDVVEIKLVENEVLLGTCPEGIRYLMEIRGIGLIDIKDLFGVGSVRESKKIELVIKLEHWKENKEYSRLGLSNNTESFLGISLPCIIMPVAPGRNLSILVEVAARNYLLKMKGIDVARRVSRRLDRNIKREVTKKKDLSNIIRQGAGLFE